MLLTAINACGGSGGSSDSNTPAPTGSAATAKTVVGTITGFGSIYLNGVEYDTDGASYDVDDETASDDSALSVGMVVKVMGSVNPDGRTGTANAVSYDDEIEGTVEELTTDSADETIKTFMVMNVQVQVSRGGTNFDAEDDPDFRFETIMNGDNVEVSGEYKEYVLMASFVEKQDAADDDFEAKGTVAGYEEGAESFMLILKNGSSLNVTLAPSAVIPSAGIQNDQYVEIEGTIPDPLNAPDSLLATKVELEDSDRLEDDDDEVELKGVLSYADVDMVWSVRDVTISFGEATAYKPASLRDAIEDRSAAGLIVEVEGDYLEGVLQVEEIELEEDELEFKADATVVSSDGRRDGIVQLAFGQAEGMKDIIVNSETMFRDDDAMDHFDLTSINAGDKVEIEARWMAELLLRGDLLPTENDS